MSNKKKNPKKEVEAEVKPEAVILKMAPEKIYRYKALEGRVLVTKSFKESEITDEGAQYFLKQLADAYDGAPYAVKVHFMSIAAPLMQKHLQKDETKAAMAAGQVVSDLTVVN
jgi:tRNA A-37 threonylcarbamoyl transferase component Bud32